MSYHRTSGQLSGMQQVDINVSRCWPQFVKESQAKAEFINNVIRDSNDPRVSELRSRFEKVMADAANNNSCPFVKGNGPIVEESHAVYNLAQQIGVPAISPQEEMQILQAHVPVVDPEPSFLRRNATPLFLGGGILSLGVIGLILLVKS